MITHERLLTLLRYDPLTGIFTWRVRRAGKADAGAPAGSRNTEGYILIGVDNKKLYAHRLAWLYVTGRWPTEYIDHVNRDPSDNRFCNLREASNQQNQGNTRAKRNNTSGFKGVRRWKNKWRACICVDGTNVHIGLFETPEEASEAYRQEAKKRFGAYVRP